MTANSTPLPPEGMSEKSDATAADISHQIGQLSSEVGPYLRVLAHRFSLNTDETADALQEALLAFFLNRTRIANPQKWMRTVVRHECLRVLRERTPGSVSLDDLSVSRAHQLEASPIADLHRRLRVGRLVADLSPRNRRVLWMRFVADMSWMQIARHLSCRPASAKKAVFRAVAAAREAAQVIAAIGLF
jgi:RNA polymerase sigma factor (sigma-70 family)